MSIYSIIYNTEIRFLDLNTHKSLIIDDNCSDRHFNIIGQMKGSLIIEIIKLYHKHIDYTFSLYQPDF